MAHLMLPAGRRVRRARVFKRPRQLADVCEREILNYRFPRDFLEDLARDFAASPVMARRTRRSHAIPPQTQILLALRWFAKGGMLSETAAYHRVSKASASRIVGRVATFLCSKAPDTIKWPDNRDGIVRSYSERYGMPCTVGAVDGTHIAIAAPTVDEWTYVNRKGWHSINTQIVCDSGLRILDVECRWPGSSHDSFILRCSDINQRFEAGEFGNYWLLGDSGYPLKPWLMTPLGDPRTPAERRYQAAHRRARSCVERCIGLMKARFRCLSKTSGVLQLKLGTSCKVVLACAVLHNLALELRLPDVAVEEHLELDQDIQHANDDARPGARVRNNLIQRFFQ